MSKDVCRNADRLRALNETIIALRTFEHHRLQLGSEHDEQVRVTAQGWFEQACGNRIPEEQHFEACIVAILRDVRDLIGGLFEDLIRVEQDAYRDLLVRQWKQGVEAHWPKHKFEEVVVQVLSDLGRTDLKAAALAERLLERMQKQLEVLSDSVDKERRLRSWLEETIRAEFPERTPVNGEDLKSMGFQPGPSLGKILGELEYHFRQKGWTRDQLLQHAKLLLESRESLDAVG